MTILEHAANSEGKVRLRNLFLVLARPQDLHEHRREHLAMRFFHFTSFARLHVYLIFPSPSAIRQI